MSLSERSPTFVKLTGSNVKLLDAVTATGTSTPHDVEAFKNYVFEVSGTATSFTLQIEVVGPSGTAYDLKVWDDLNNGFIGTDITVKGIYSVSLPVKMKFQANLTAVSGGNITVDGGLGQ